MKKSTIWIIILSAIMFIFIASFLHHIFYFKNFHENSAPATEAEKEKALEILNKSIDISNYQIKFGNIYTLENKKIIYIELIKDDSKEHYSIDITNNRIIKR